ncbi:hypothetical protein IL306_012824 [Fusarium sp. DS 682]|nr:hypothetical protein IL306_012824 [Fusarium sp. DS 682]
MSQPSSQPNPESFWPTINQAIKNGRTTNADNEPISPQCPICFDPVPVRSFPDKDSHGERSADVLICGHIFCQPCRYEFDASDPNSKCPICRHPLFCSRCGTHAISFGIPKNGEGDKVSVPTTLPEGAEHGTLCPDCTATEEFHENVDIGEWPEALDDLEPGFINFFYHTVNKLEKKGEIATKNAIINAFAKTVYDEFYAMMTARREVTCEQAKAHRQKNMWFPEDNEAQARARMGIALHRLRRLPPLRRPELPEGIDGVGTPPAFGLPPPDEETSPVDYTRLEELQEPPLPRVGPRPTSIPVHLVLSENTPPDFADTALPLQFAGLTTEPSHADRSIGQVGNIPRSVPTLPELIASTPFRNTDRGMEWRIEQTSDEYRIHPPSRINLAQGIYIEPRGSTERDGIVTTIMEYVFPRPANAREILQRLGTMLDDNSTSSDSDVSQPVSER